MRRTLVGLLHVLFGRRSTPARSPLTRSLDSKDRFYGTIFLAYGAVVTWAPSLGAE